MASEVTLKFITTATIAELLSFIEHLTPGGTLNNCDNEEGDMLSINLVAYKIETPGVSTISASYGDD